MLFGDKKLKDILKNSALLTLATFIISYPYLYHLMVHKPDYLSPFNSKIESMTGDQITIFALAHVATLMLLLFLSSFVGFGFSEKYKFQGFGNRKILKKDLPYILIIALPISILLFFTYDKALIEKIPTLYPSLSHWGLAKAFMTASIFEIVSKFGLVTIVMGVFRNKHVAVIAPALFFAFLVRNTFHDYGVDYGFNYLAILGTLSAFAYSVISGYLYIKRGLLSVIALKFALDLKFFIYPLFF